MAHKNKDMSSFQFDEDIKRMTIDNLFYRRVLCTGLHSQVVLMSIPPGVETGEQREEDTDKMVFIVRGKAESTLNRRAQEAGKNDFIFIPAGKVHNLKNVGRRNLKLFATYSPPLFADGTLHRTQEDARAETFAHAWEQ
jgi:mannose-6-phosphate isomerase-like protein (cupin superfamily)